MKINREFRPESGNWQCAKCLEPLQSGQVDIHYLGSTFTIGALICPRCSQALIPEDTAVGKMLDVEQLLEDK